MTPKEHQQDVVIKLAACDCTITFFWRSGWKTSRFDACATHASKEYDDTQRDIIMQVARLTKNEILKRRGVTAPNPNLN